MANNHSASRLDVTLRQAKLLMLAQSVEQSSDLRHPFSAADKRAATDRVRHTLGVDAEPKALLIARARDILKTAEDRGIATQIRTDNQPARYVFIVLVLMSFLLGMGTDRIGAQSNYINLLSLPFWGVIIWNLAMYVTLSLRCLGFFRQTSGHFYLPFRQVLHSIYNRVSTFSFTRSFKNQFFKTWAQLISPLVDLQIARTLHASAFAFALGVIISLLVRGFTTSYTVGWESTWFHEAPEVIRDFLNMTYGLIPSFGGLLPDMPDVAQVTAMRADLMNLPNATPVSAGPWLIRMILLMTLVVIIPRIILMGWDSWRIHRFYQHVKLSMDVPYWREILASISPKASALPICVMTSDAQRADRNTRIETFLKDWPKPENESIVDSTSTTTNPYFYQTLLDEDAPLPSIAQAHPTLIAAWFDGIETPEMEVHGAALQRLNNYAQTHAVHVVAVVDMSDFANRYDAKRLEERQTVWTAFLGLQHVEVFVLTNTLESRQALLDQLLVLARAKQTVLAQQTNTAQMQEVTTPNASEATHV